MSESIPPVQTVSASAAPSSTRAWEVLCHVSSIVGMLGYAGFIPFGNIVAPLLVWLYKRNESVGVDVHGKESLNFHISWTMYWIIASTIVGLLCIVIIGIFLLPVLLIAGAIGWVAMLILTIIASVKASNGEVYRYPLTIRFLK